MSPEPTPAPQEPATPPQIIVDVIPGAPQTTKKEAVIVASKEGATSFGYTGGGVSGAAILVVAAKRLGHVEMSIEEAVIWMGGITWMLTPILRIAWSLLRQWLQHRNYQVE